MSIKKMTNKENKEYDRMNPEINKLLEKLEKYFKIDYGREAYPLSRAEAKLLVEKCGKK